MAEIFTHQDMPRDRIVHATRQDIDTARGDGATLFRILFTLETAGAVKSLEAMTLPDMKVTPESTWLEAAKTDLLMAMNRTESGYDGRLIYAVRECTRDMAGDWLAKFPVLLRNLLNDPEQDIFRAPMLSTQKRARLLAEAGRAPSPFPDHGLVDVFREMAGKYPDKVVLQAAKAIVPVRDPNCRSINRYQERCRGLGKPFDQQEPVMR
jgi:non-ribosomal peptide synthetase component F